LASSGFQCHDPFLKSSDKASAGSVAEGFSFLSFQIFPGKFFPTRSARIDFIDDLKTAITIGKSEIQASGSDTRRAEPRYVQTLALLDRKIIGWGDAFRPTTDRLIFEQLDEKIRVEIENFQNWFAARRKTLSAREYRRALGIALLFDTPIPD